MSNESNKPYERNNKAPSDDAKVDDTSASRILTPPMSPTPSGQQDPRTPYWSRSLETWSYVEVAEWTASLGEDFDKYAAVLKRKKVDGKTLLSLKESTLKTVISDELDFEVFWVKLNELKKKVDEPSVSNLVICFICVFCLISCNKVFHHFSQ